MQKALTASALLLILPGCALTLERPYASPILAVYAPDRREIQEEVRDLAQFFEEAIVSLTDEFEVPLEDVIPVRVYADSSPGKSYYNRFTRSIVLKGPPEPSVFVHELSHLLAHRIVRSPPYWSDQALAEYLEEKVCRRGPARTFSTAAKGPASRTRLLMERIARARDPSEVLDHLTTRAVDEDRSWGAVFVKYLLEDRWTDVPSPERIRRLLRLTEDEVADLAPEVLDYCRRSELVVLGE